MRAGRSRGFTLIEMVIAFAILGLTLTVLYSSFEASLARSRHDHRLSEATMLAQSLLAQAGVEHPLNDGTSRGSHQGFDYEIREARTEVPVNESPLTIPTFKVTALVTWPEAGGVRSLSLTTLKLAIKVE